MKINIGFIGTDPLPPTVGVVQKAEACGLNGVSYSEHGGFHDAIVPSVLYLQNTSNIEINVLGLSAAERHPGALAMELASLAELGPGRVRAQVGTGAPTMLRQICANMYHPVPRVRSLVEALRTLLAGKELTGVFAAGSFDKYGLVRLEGLDILPLQDRTIPIDVMAIRPQMLKLAAQVGDGVVLTGGTSAEYLSWAVKFIETELAAAGRSREDFRITALAFGVIMPGFEKHFPVLRMLLETYAPELAVHTMMGIVDGVQYEREAREDLKKAGETFFTDDVTEQLTVAAAGVEDMSRILRRYADTGVDIVDIHLVGPANTRVDAVETIAAASAIIV